VGPRADLDAVKKNLLPLPEIEPRPASPQPVTIPTGLLAEAVKIVPMGITLPVRTSQGTLRLHNKDQTVNAWSNTGCLL
jgi:hypothetical protein